MLNILNIDISNISYAIIMIYFEILVRRILSHPVPIFVTFSSPKNCSCPSTWYMMIVFLDHYLNGLVICFHISMKCMTYSVLYIFSTIRSVSASVNSFNSTSVYIKNTSHSITHPQKSEQDPVRISQYLYLENPRIYLPVIAYHFT